MLSTSSQPESTGAAATLGRPPGYLVIDTRAREVVDANDAARQLIGALQIPFRVDAWAEEVELLDLHGEPLRREGSPLVRVASGESLAGLVCSIGHDGDHCHVRVETIRLPELGERALVLLLPIDAEPGATLRDRAIVAAELPFVIAEMTADDERLVYVSPAFERMTGYAAEEAIGQNCRFLQGAATAPASVDDLRAGIKGHVHATTVLLNYRKDGSAFWNEVSLGPVIDTDGKVRYFVGVQADVTSRVEAEREREEARREAVAARRAAELASGRLAFLDRASRLLGKALDPDDIVREMTDLVVPGLGDACITIVEPDPVARGTTAATVDGVVGERLDSADLVAAAPGLLARAVDGRLDAGAIRAELGEVGLDRGQVVALTDGRRTLGNMLLLRGDGHEEGLADDRRLMAQLTSRLTTAIDVTRRYVERDRIAEALQRALLPPPLPDIPGVQLAGRYLPAGSGLEVGGDFYDVFDIAGAHAIAFGDVCGKGPDAAAVTGLARHTLRALAMQSRSPARVLGLLNAVLLRELPPEKFVTAIYALLRPVPAGQELTFAVGGHALPWLRRGSGAIERPGSEGMVLGITEDAGLSEGSIELAPGDTLALVTDGVLEASGGYDEGLVGDALHELAEVSAGAVADGIIARAASEDGAFRDDAAVLVLRVLREDDARRQDGHR